MADTNPAAPPVAAPDPKTVPSPATPPAPDANKPEYITKAEFTEWQKRLDGISASLRKLEPLATAITPPEPKKEADTLKSLKEQIDARDARITARERNAALNEALESAGVPADRRGKAAKYILAEHGQKMAQADDGSFQYKENDTVSALQDWVALYMKTDDGKFINPEPAPVPNTTTKGMTGSARTNGAVQSGSLEKLSYSELMANPAAAAALRQEKPDVWEAKRAEWFATSRSKKK